MVTMDTMVRGLLMLNLLLLPSPDMDMDMDMVMELAMAMEDMDTTDIMARGLLMTCCSDPELMGVMRSHHAAIVVSLCLLDQLLDELILLSTTAFIHVNDPPIMETTEKLCCLFCHKF